MKHMYMSRKDIVDTLVKHSIEENMCKPVCCKQRSRTVFLVVNVFDLSQIGAVAFTREDAEKYKSYLSAKYPSTDFHVMEVTEGTID